MTTIYRAHMFLFGVAMIFFMLGLSSCRSKEETDSFIIVEMLQRERGPWCVGYTVEQREILRQQIEQALRNK